MSTSFHPQTNGQTECMNCSVGQIFHTMVCPDQKDWINKIDFAEFAINLENLHTGPSGGGWDMPPHFPTLNQNTAAHRTTYPQHPNLPVMYGGGYPPPYHGHYPSIQHGAWGPGWAPPTNQPTATYGILTLQEAMEVDDSHPQPEPAASNMVDSPQQQEKKKDKGKKHVTPRELREHDEEERRERRRGLNCLLRDLDREGATLKDDNNMTDGPPRMKRKDPALLNYVEPELEDKEEDLDSPPMSPDLDGLSERQQAQEKWRYNIAKQQFDNKKRKQELEDKAIPGRIPDTLGVVEQRWGWIK
ncbi:hypothetical protein BDQ17DRAFT_1333120 [Cyathus striatus]|nr:hypothetical protein BDQ17DRAFT_1333120 [Cyathus striatus]